MRLLGLDVLVVTSIPPASNGPNINYQCNALSSALPSQVLYPNTSMYNERIDTIWSVTAQLHPWCFVLPENINDTSVVIRTLVTNQCPFGIKGGGHTHFSGGNSIHDGVTIDFGYLNTTAYDADTKIASIPPGTPWQTVYETLEP